MPPVAPTSVATDYEILQIKDSDQGHTLMGFFMPVEFAAEPGFVRIERRRFARNLQKHLGVPVLQIEFSDWQVFRIHSDCPQIIELARQKMYALLAMY